METSILSGVHRKLLPLSIALIFGLFSVASDVSAGQGSLDGKTFVVETGEKGKSAGDKDTLIFKDGNFHSTGCDQYGFGDGAYTSTVSGGAITFEAVTTSPTHGH